MLDSFDFTMKGSMDKSHHEVFKESIHAEKSSDWKIVLKCGVDIYGTAGQVDTDFMNPAIGRASDT